jgi:hypothetical protein
VSGVCRNIAFIRSQYAGERFKIWVSSAEKGRWFAGLLVCSGFGTENVPSKVVHPSSCQHKGDICQIQELFCNNLTYTN